jgi:hypothetical protein
MYDDDGWFIGYPSIEEMEEWQEREKREKDRKEEHEKKVAPKRRFWVVFSTWLCGILGGGAFFATVFYDISDFAVAFMGVAFFATILAVVFADGLIGGFIFGVIYWVVLAVLGWIASLIPENVTLIKPFDMIVAGVFGAVFGVINGRILGPAIGRRAYRFKDKD